MVAFAAGAVISAPASGATVKTSALIMALALVNDGFKKVMLNID